MRIGVPTERTQGESRVALAPHAVYELTRAGHRVFVEAGAGRASSIADERYEEAGARLVEESGLVYADSEIVVKVYGPVEEEYEYLREDLVLISFLSLPVNPELMQALIDSRCVAFAMETIRDERGLLPVDEPDRCLAQQPLPQCERDVGRGRPGTAGLRTGAGDDHPCVDPGVHHEWLSDATLVARADLVDSSM